MHGTKCQCKNKRQCCTSVSIDCLGQRSHNWSNVVYVSYQANRAVLRSSVKYIVISYQADIYPPVHFKTFSIRLE